MKGRAMEFCIKPPGRGEYKQILNCFSETRGLRYYSTNCRSMEYLFGGGCEMYAAYDEDGEMAGVMGIYSAPFDEDVPLMGILNVRPAYAGLGIARKLTCHIMRLLEDRGVRSIKAHVVTKHKAVQQIVEDYSLLPSGLLMGVRDGKNTEPPHHGKDALAVYVKNISARDDVRLYLHEDIKGFAYDVYADLGVSITGDAGGQLGPRSEIRHLFDGHDSLLSVQVFQCGADLPQALRELADRYSSASPLTQTVFLNLGSPTAVHGYEMLRESGYSFCGFDPLGKYEHAVFFFGSSEMSGAKMSRKLAELAKNAARINGDLSN